MAFVGCNNCIQIAENFHSLSQTIALYECVQFALHPIVGIRECVQIGRSVEMGDVREKRWAEKDSCGNQ